MGKLQDTIERLKAATEQAQTAAILRIVQSNRPIVIDLNTKQLFQGRDNQDQPLKPLYKNPKYAELKLYLNPNGVVDLKLTGAFYDSFFIEDGTFPILFGATDEKTGELVAKYGEQIFGLTITSKGELSEQLREEIRDYYRREVFNV